MTRKELIEIAKNCGAGDCHPACPYKEGEWDLESVMYCMEDLISALADKLEMALADVPHNCGTCLHAGKKLRDIPCSVCLTGDYQKEWQWKGDAE